MSLKLLIIGNPYDAHIVRFVKYIKRSKGDLDIDLFGIKQGSRVVSDDLIRNVGNLFLARQNDYSINVKGFGTLLWIWNMRKYFHQIVVKKQYDIAQIHYPSFYHTFLLRDLRKSSKKIVLTPWGSDVYRISSIERLILKRLYSKADIVTGNGLRFTKDFMCIYNIPKYKFRCLSLGADDIDYFKEHYSDFSTKDAKHNFAIGENVYVITCGYNGSPAQQHLKIIESINKVRNQLPTNILLFFPFTYGGTKEYRDSIKKEVTKLGYQARYVEEYLDLKDLFLLRLATDMFIHIQTTDANNGSLKHYVWLEKNVINGAWLKYDDIEKEGYIPYHTTSSVDELGNTILEAYRNGPVCVNKETKRTIEHYGYSYLAPRWVEMFESIV